MQDSNLAPFDRDDARMFLTVVRAGQISAAARRVGVNQATLSRRMAGLERATGEKLLVRRTHGSELTPAGGGLLRTLGRVEAEMLACQARLGRAEAAVEGVVRVGAPSGFGTAFLARGWSGCWSATPAWGSSWCPRPAASGCRGARRISPS